MPHELPVELVDEEVDGRIKIRCLRIGEDFAAHHVECRLRALDHLFHRQYQVCVGDVVIMTLQAQNLFAGIGAKRIGDIDVMAGNAELHRTDSVVGVRCCRCV